ncbi:hypothetical protein IFM89_023141 [Coptis chinensis]|uniref:Uncharacterized protein n=1 Tax=Coptis chinensis TaxID=261450 RepID=A0A835H553_9MAGN|nr:hypothetical protein IFM89_023141 [Coptis chinensis]
MDVMLNSRSTFRNNDIGQRGCISMPLLRKANPYILYKFFPPETEETLNAPAVAALKLEQMGLVTKINKWVMTSDRFLLEKVERPRDEARKTAKEYGVIGVWRYYEKGIANAQKSLGLGQEEKVRNVS